MLDVGLESWGHGKILGGSGRAVIVEEWKADSYLSVGDMLGLVNARAEQKAEVVWGRISGKFSRVPEL